MPCLSDQLDNFVDTINNGPAALDPNLFSGPADRIMLGLKAHANTISHARLIALEETFPMTRNMIGDDVFNGLSRSFTETETGRASDINSIGAAFPAFLKTRNVDLSAVDLAAVEWAWLESYNAAEAKPLLMTDLAKLDEAAMLALPIERHPAARIVKINAPLSPELSDLGDDKDMQAILVTRPESEVRLHAIDRLTLLIFNEINNFCEMGNLLSLALEQGGEDAPLEPILNLIGSGSVTSIQTNS